MSEEKASELECRITRLLIETKYTFERKERDEALKLLNELAKQYYELTGTHYNFYRENKLPFTDDKG
jgi:hypothetical protein